jgi:hypothetical protein
MKVKEGMVSPNNFNVPGPEFVNYQTRATRTYGKVGVGGTPLTHAFSPERAIFFAKATAHLSTWVHLDSPGFLPQRRQHRQFGLAVLHMAQALLEHAAALVRGDAGLAVSDAASSKRGYYGWIPIEKKNKDKDKEKEKDKDKDKNKEKEKDKDKDKDQDKDKNKDKDKDKDKEGSFHKFGWRDLFDIAVRWRQITEPMDTVFWIDRLALKTSFEDRVGLSTFINSGHKKVLRYYPYNDWAINITKKILTENGYNDVREQTRTLNPSQLSAVASAVTHKDIHMAVGARPFFHVLPCGSIKYPGKALNGTRLSLTQGAATAILFV